MRTLIKNGRVIDPATNKDGIYDILIEDGIIVKVGEKLEDEADKVIDARDSWVVPGLIDIHVHLREPGFEHKETIKTGSESAAKGGFTTICTMPNTNPVIDSEYLVEYLNLKAQRDSVVNILPIGSITKGQKGEELANIGNMAKAGICGISEDGHTVMNAALYKKAMTYAKMFDLIVFAHCEDKSLVGKGVMNAGDRALSLGLAGISNDVEDVITARDILLAEKTGAKLHLCHISTEGSLRLLKRAKEDNIDVTAEICPHHFILSDEAINGFDTNFKMNPPLRSKFDVEALKQGLKDDVIEIIATDHAPHHYDEKNTTFDEAAFGIVGLETSVALTITELVDKGWITPKQMIEKMSLNPAKRLGIEKGTLKEGSVADVTIIDPKRAYKIDVNQFASKSKNSPFHNKEVKGMVTHTIVGGQVVYRVDSEI
ncbi:dihydroorotase [Natranaerovirga pectinivora]|uniref:Dihydroorotase n=1 Tax=Natranaerovirga pectinivora TaxID=682400 RepID=A0A4R3MPZ3_9FIRM|nr:dihydroorotase [Natranaerovirga pectinivora]TCT14345.1 dihydroorotase [Natranaerovirga pectinivora]